MHLHRTAITKDGKIMICAATLEDSSKLKKGRLQKMILGALSIHRFLTLLNMLPIVYNLDTCKMEQ
jgi:hypothetical protein